MIPLRDELPTELRPYVTVGLIVLNVGIFAAQLTSPGGMVVEYGFTPSSFFYEGQRLHLLTSMFLHGGFWHLAGNMLYLWIFGNNVEDSMGHLRFVVFYVLCGCIGTLAHAWTAPTSGVPMIGASGAISGILGAYLVLYPRARILTLIPLGFFIHIVKVPAVVVLGFWIVVQLLNGGLSLGVEGGGVAWFAHIGGFLAGMALIAFFLRPAARIRRFS